MTISKTDRLKDADLALQLMMQELGERAFRSQFMSPTNEPPYERILSTTWKCLEDRLLIEPFPAGRKRRYALTGSGWLKGLEVTDALDATKEKAGRVMADLKKRMEGGQHRVQANEVAEGAGVTIDFVHNMLDSDFIRAVFKRVGVKFRHATQAYAIEIPINFHHELS